MTTQQKKNYTDLLYPKIEPYDTGFIRVSEIHTLYYEQSGNPYGNPVIFLHGGPGSGTTPNDRRYFDPKVYRIILMDQRGSGKSTPLGCLEQNTTWDLVSDIEKLRDHLKIDKWVVFGGSWGSTLSLTYSETHPDRVKALIVRGIYLSRESEILWFNQEGGASNLFPDYWDEYYEAIPENERDNYVAAYYKRLTSNNEEEKLYYAKIWTKWEDSASKLYIDIDTDEDPKKTLSYARIECHYLINKGFFDTPNYLLDNIDKIRDIPGVIIQGRYDCICPATSAWELHKKWPEAEFHMLPDCGHSPTEYGIAEKLVAAADKFKYL
ncbi:proline iminopeptidase [Anaeromyces robustus]|uniref:Proline iminopeptidase n=1 Tax=Anaeromyces robustus TaxID=1754192 RepID=A0A1Y1X3G7_9FUNG|nr:proline iminopeptidase [Anaeromyces robustus]|eukprot:ORX80323.1 proline iminopeptidase [Anaeromyces robustus]